MSQVSAAPRASVGEWARLKAPGIGLAVAVAVVATLVNKAVSLIAAPAAGIVIGFVVALALKPGVYWREGLAVVRSRALRTAIVVFGTGLSLTQVGQFGLRGLPVVVLTLVLVGVLTPVLGKLYGVHGNVRTLIGAGSAFCGTSAIAAITPIIGATEVEIAYAVGAIFTLNTVSVFTFPLLGHAIGMSEHAFGVWSGVAIHDTSSVVAASVGYGAVAGSVAIVVKMTRTLALIPVSMFLAVRRARTDGGAGGAKFTSMVPLFLIGFVTMAAVNSIGLIPGGWHTPLNQIGTFLVTCALSAVGLLLRPSDMAQTGHRPLLMALTMWIAVIVFSFALVRVLPLPA